MMTCFCIGRNWNTSMKGNYNMIQLYFLHSFEEHKHVKIVIVWYKCIFKKLPRKKLYSKMSISHSDFKCL